MQPYLLPNQNETDRGYLHPTAGAWQDLQATLNCLLPEPVTIGGDMLYLNSIGAEIELAACALPSRGEPGEGGVPEGGGLDALCACEQSLYWATQSGFDCASEELIYFYHPDYLGSVEFVTDMRGEPYQFFLNTPWGENLENQFAKSYTSFSSRFRFNGKEWDEETGNFYYGARYYDPKVSVWLSVDPLMGNNPHLSPYNSVSNNPIMRIDPDGMDDGEYEWDKTNQEWQKVSTKGDNIGIDFYHWDGSYVDQEGKTIDYQTTYVTDRNGNWNTISNGRKWLQGTMRDQNVNYRTIYDEWKNGTGPEHSYIEGSHPMNIELNSDGFIGAAYMDFILNDRIKEQYKKPFGLSGYLIAGLNMQLQMMGSYNVSMYKLGEKTLILGIDSKSRTSFYYHANIPNYTRAQGRPGFYGSQKLRETTTHQTYLFLR